MRLALSFIAPLLTAAGAAAAPALFAQARPNIVLIMADDLGYGELGCYGQKIIKTPNIDELARDGVRFTDFHCGAPVCAPSRCVLMTGKHLGHAAIRNNRQVANLFPELRKQYGWEEPGQYPLPADEVTVAELLKANGYATACIGKWHLGMDLPADYTQPIRNGPLAAGFDTYFGISASLDMVPYTFIVDNHVAAAPTVDKTWPMHPGYPAECRLGPAAPDFEVENVLPTLARKAADYIAERARTKQPFFLYLPLNAPHTPIAPTKEWRGKSGLNLYADYVMETDWAIGEVLDALDRAGVAGNTLVILTSDNGCSPSADYPELLAKGHNPSYVFRGTRNGMRCPPSKMSAFVPRNT